MLALLIGVPGLLVGYLLSRDWPFAALIAILASVGAAITDSNRR
jgi:hypothetical protein